LSERFEKISPHMIVPTSDLFKLAYEKYAIGAYNISNLEQTLALFKGCADARSPFIIQLSKGARKYADKEDVKVDEGSACPNGPRGSRRIREAD
jgi:fructose/tagatose bisphosphate aldolase